MARAGILYSQVAKAAAALATSGANPTVDTVRAALGNTGSRSTIAPMLKQWKAAYQADATAAAAGLPADLLEAVQAVYQRVETHAQLQLAPLREAAERDKAQLGEQLAAALDAAASARKEAELLTAALQQARAELAKARSDCQDGAVRQAALQAEKEGLQQRLADRAAEVKQLAGQLTLAREQFEHYQKATDQQRERDRNAYEGRIVVLEQEAQRLRGYLQEHQQAVAVLRAEKQEWEERLARTSTEAKESMGEVYRLREQLAAAREMASGEHMTAEMTVARLHQALQDNARLDERIAALKDENTRLRHQQGATAPAGAGKRR